MLHEELIQIQLLRCPHGCLQTLPDRLALNFNFPKVVSADNVLQQMWQFRERALLAIG